MCRPVLMLICNFKPQAVLGLIRYLKITYSFVHVFIIHMPLSPQFIHHPQTFLAFLFSVVLYSRSVKCIFLFVNISRLSPMCLLTSITFLAFSASLRWLSQSLRNSKLAGRTVVGAPIQCIFHSNKDVHKWEWFSLNINTYVSSLSFKFLGGNFVAMAQ